MSPKPLQSTSTRSFLAERAGMPINAFNALAVDRDHAPETRFRWSEKEIRQLLELFHLPSDTPLSVLAVEMMPRDDQHIVLSDASDLVVRPLPRELEQYRILRTSPLVAAPAVCCEGVEARRSIRAVRTRPIG